MNNKNSTLHVNLLPIIIIIVLIIGAGYLLTDGEIKVPFFDSSNEVKAEHVEGFPREVYTTEILEKERLVIKSQEELDDYLNTLDPTGLTKIEDSFNFGREWVLALSSKTLDTDGYKLKVKKVYIDPEDDSILVSALLTKPGNTCEVEEVTNVAVDMVKIKHTEKEIKFERLKETKECGDIEPEDKEDIGTEEGTEEDMDDMEEKIEETN